MPWVQQPDSRAGDGYTWNYVEDSQYAAPVGGGLALRGGSENLSWGTVGQALGGVAGAIGGLVTGTGVIHGATVGAGLGGQLFGGGSGGSPNLPALPGGGGGWNTPATTLGNMFPGVLPGSGGGPPAKGHWTKGTKRNPSHWTNRRRPRMNPMNVRAARRAVGRIHAAEKLFRRILQVSHPGHAAGRIAPKRRKR